MSILVVAALPQELGNSFDDVPVVYTGVGKVNAAHALTRAIHIATANAPPELRLVVNFGTAATSRSLPGSLLPGTLVRCNRIVQYDMDCSPLGVEEGVTPFEDVPKILDLPFLPALGMDKLPMVPCHTADRFAKPKDMEYCGWAAHDMEAYALAKVCFFEKLPFVCVKYITDSGDPEQWKANCSKAGPLFREVYDRLALGLSYEHV